MIVWRAEPEKVQILCFCSDLSNSYTCSELLLMRCHVVKMPAFFLRLLRARGSLFTG